MGKGPIDRAEYPPTDAEKDEAAMVVHWMRSAYPLASLNLKAVLDRHTQYLKGLWKYIRH